MCIDKSVVKKVQKGDSHAYVGLVKKYQPLLINFCYKKTQNLALSEDIVQESLVKGYFKITSFEGRSSFKNWLFKITINTLRNKIKKDARPYISLEKINFIVEDSISEDLIHDKQVKALLVNEIKKLPFKQQRALKLRVFNDLSFKEISKLMDCQYDTAKANYRHGLLKLKKSFEQEKLWNLKELLINKAKKVHKKYELL